MATISGVWKWNDALTETGWASTDSIKEFVNFKALGYNVDNTEYIDFRNFDRFEISSNAVLTEKKRLYGTNSKEDADFSEITYYFSGETNVGWKTAYSGDEYTIDELKTVDFGEEAQTVSSAFYDWFTANATPTTWQKAPGIYRLREDYQDETTLNSLLGYYDDASVFLSDNAGAILFNEAPYYGMLLDYGGMYFLTAPTVSDDLYANTVEWYDCDTKTFYTDAATPFTVTKSLSASPVDLELFYLLFEKIGEYVQESPEEPEIPNEPDEPNEPDISDKSIAALCKEIAEKIPHVKRKGYDAGKQAAYDTFWDAFQNNGSRRVYTHAFANPYWNDTAYNPKYPIKVSQPHYAASLFDANTAVTDTKVDIDLSEVTTTSSISRMFVVASKLTTIRKIILNENIVFSEDCFNGCTSLVNLTLEGTLGKNGFDVHWSTKLSRASIESIISALSSTTSGLTVTISKTAKEASFSDEAWAALIETKPNWTIALA